ncbi:hypothetical protein BZG01_10850 [Labilibaculum manganireducens]|uniref:Signal peptidase I n=1 Tax=Labilibaculum manganireducens TaxID=1940525 RepID=A0A2N3I886_9BACT|nr:signal peptidase I [Labilibaculum manganireducens]PKQ66516.1 hypothetical protein BZG01_10850 [Labilibaculum manganireducens]
MKIKTSKYLRLIEKLCYVVFYVLVFVFVMKTFFISIYQIPSESMWPTIQPGDWICVDKIGFGGTKHLFGREFSLPKYRTVKRGDVMVFHFPEGDTVFLDNPQLNYYETLELKKRNEDSNFTYINCNKKVSLPLSYQIPYVKRCVGLPGEVIQTIDYKLYINGKALGENREEKKLCNVYYQDKMAVFKLKTTFRFCWNPSEDCSVFSLTNQEQKLFKLSENIDSVRIRKKHRCCIYYFPKELDKEKDWDAINYGPIEIPKKGKRLSINTGNIAAYKRLIETYEGNSLAVKQDSIKINGITTDYYVPKQNYYFMMGDYRTNSIDSRNWGFVPEDHLIGRAFAVGWSREPGQYAWEGIRWARVGNSLTGNQSE